MKVIFSALTMIALIFIVFLFVHFEDERSEARLQAEEVLEHEGLHPYVEQQMNAVIEDANEIGITVVVTDDYRSIEEQDHLHAQGRSEDGQVVTHAEGGESYHNYGLAVDFALVNDAGEVIWDMEYDGNNNGEADWYEVVEIAEDHGFEWGGHWQHFPDYPHLQMTFGLSIRELQQAAEDQAT